VKHDTAASAPPKPVGKFTIQVAAYSSRELADALVKRLEAKGSTPAPWARRVRSACGSVIQDSRSGDRCRREAQGAKNRGTRHRDRPRRRMSVSGMSSPTQTPLMQQYREIKGRHQNAILFFRHGRVL
jgi:hypothetical protein